MRSAPHELTLDAVRARLLYDPGTGLFTRRIAVALRPVGSVAGSPTKDGYITIHVLGRKYRAHRLAWFYVHGRWPLAGIDHINGARTDNRISNLREATCYENHQNRIVKGYSPNKGKWVARIKVKGKFIYLGTYERAEDAQRAYLGAKQDLHPFSMRMANTSKDGS